MRVGVVGCGGRMGRRLIAAVVADAEAELIGAVARSGSDVQGMDAGLLAGVEPLNLRIGDDPVGLFADADVVLDFTTPESTVAFAALAAQGKTAHIIGTTGLSDADDAALAKAARHTAIVRAPNTAVGPTLLQALVEMAAQRLGPDWDIEILEMHHRAKVDAPSGTAVALGEAAARGRAVTLSDAARWSREGHTGPRPDGEIGFATLRGGSVAGEHMVTFAADGERLELGHRASDRSIFAKGAVRAARWAVGKPPGLYTMRDVLGL